MQKMKIFETKKLHYNKYLYKIDIGNALAAWFRTEVQKGNLEYLKTRLDECQLLHNNGETLYRWAFRTQVPIDNQDFLDAKIIYNKLLPAEDYKIRIDSWHSLIIYSNDKELLVDIGNNIKNKHVTFWEPKKENIDILKNTKSIILVDHEPEFKYKVMFNYKRIDPNFGNWLEKNNNNLIKVGKKTLRNVKSGYAFNNYIYVKTEKILSLLDIMTPNNIRSIEELVCKHNIDKQLYGTK